MRIYYKIDEDNIIMTRDEFTDLLSKIERLQNEFEIKDRLINGIYKRLTNHFRKIDRTGFEDNKLLIEIEDLIKQVKGSEK